MWEKAKILAAATLLVLMLQTFAFVPTASAQTPTEPVNWDPELADPSCWNERIDPCSEAGSGMAWTTVGWKPTTVDADGCWEDRDWADVAIIQGRQLFGSGNYKMPLKRTVWVPIDAPDGAYTVHVKVRQIAVSVNKYPTMIFRADGGGSGSPWGAAVGATTVMLFFNFLVELDNGSRVELFDWTDPNPFGTPNFYAIEFFTGSQYYYLHPVYGRVGWYNEYLGTFHGFHHNIHLLKTTRDNCWHSLVTPYPMPNFNEWYEFVFDYGRFIRTETLTVYLQHMRNLAQQRFGRTLRKVLGAYLYTIAIGCEACGATYTVEYDYVKVFNHTPISNGNFIDDLFKWESVGFSAVYFDGSKRATNDKTKTCTLKQDIYLPHILKDRQNTFKFKFYIDYANCVTKARGQKAFTATLEADRYRITLDISYPFVMQYPYVDIIAMVYNKDLKLVCGAICYSASIFTFYTSWLDVEIKLKKNSLEYNVYRSGELRFSHTVSIGDQGLPLVDVYRQVKFEVLPDFKVYVDDVEIAMAPYLDQYIVRFEVDAATASKGTWAPPEGIYFCPPGSTITFNATATTSGYYPRWRIRMLGGVDNVVHNNVLTVTVQNHCNITLCFVTQATDLVPIVIEHWNSRGSAHEQYYGYKVGEIKGYTNPSFGTYNFTNNALVTFTAYEYSGYTFIRWIGITRNWNWVSFPLYQRQITVRINNTWIRFRAEYSSSAVVFNVTDQTTNAILEQPKVYVWDEGTWREVSYARYLDYPSYGTFFIRKGTYTFRFEKAGYYSKTIQLTVDKLTERTSVSLSPIIYGGGGGGDVLLLSKIFTFSFAAVNSKEWYFDFGNIKIATAKANASVHIKIHYVTDRPVIFIEAANVSAIWINVDAVYRESFKCPYYGKVRVKGWFGLCVNANTQLTVELANMPFKPVEVWKHKPSENATAKFATWTALQNTFKITVEPADPFFNILANPITEAQNVAVQMTALIAVITMLAVSLKYIKKFNQ